MTKAKEEFLFGVEYRKSGEEYEEVICNPELVNNHTEYQFAAVLVGIPTEDFDVEVSAKCFVAIDGVKYYMFEKTYSVNSLAKYYFDNLSSDAAVSEHLGMLSWLAEQN